MRRLTVALIIVIVTMIPCRSSASATRYPETPYPVCSVGGYAQIDVTDTISMTRFDGYWMRVSQSNPGLTDGSSLPIFPEYRYKFTDSSIVNNIGGIPVVLYYCYDVHATPPISSDGNISTCDETPSSWSLDPLDEFSITFVEGYTYSMWHNGTITQFLDDTHMIYVSNSESTATQYTSGSAEGSQQMEGHVTTESTGLTLYGCRTPDEQDRCVSYGPGWEIVTNDEIFTVIGVTGQDTKTWNYDSVALFGSQHDGMRIQIFDHSYSGNFGDIGPNFNVVANYAYVVVGSNINDTWMEIDPTRPDNDAILTFAKPVHGDPSEWNSGYVCVQLHLIDAPTPTPNRPDPEQTRTPLPTATPNRPNPQPTRTPTRTPYPTTVSQCSRLQMLPGAVLATQINNGAFIRTLNGIALIGGVNANYSVGTTGLTWPEASGSYQIGAISISDGGSQLIIEICQVGNNATPTRTITPTAPALPCAIADSIGIPVSPGTAIITLAVGVRFVVAGATIFINVDDQPREIRVGNYEWQLGAGDYTAYSLTSPATVWICAGSTSTALPTPAPSQVATAACVVFTPTSTMLAYAMPSLSFVIPLRASPTATMTTTAIISITALIALQQTIEAEVMPRLDNIATMTSRFSWSSGQLVGQTALVIAEPALSWMAIANPQNPAWSIEGGPLWALEPFLGPIIPVLAVLAYVAFARLALWVLDWILKLIRLVIALIEMIPFM